MLLDTNAAIWLTSNLRMKAGTSEKVTAAANEGRLFLSAISAWEIGLLTARRRIDLSIPVTAWLDALVTLRGVTYVPLDWQTAFAATRLPGTFHNDPADRFLVATARVLHVPILTRDRLILDYAAQGHVAAVEC